MQVQASRQTKAPLIGVAVVAVVLDITLAQEGEAVVRAAPVRVLLVARGDPAVKAIQAVRAAVAGRGEVTAILLVAQTHVQEDRVAGQVFMLSATHSLHTRQQAQDKDQQDNHG